MANELHTYYFEGHITIDPVPPERLDALKAVIEPRQFRLAELVMIKRLEATNGTSIDVKAAHTEDAFVSCRAEHISLAIAMIRDCVEALQKAGFHVRRYKMEDTIVDSRKFDAWGYLNEQR